MFANNSRGMLRLKAKYADVEFLVIYVREAHPGSRIAPHADYDEKLRFARLLRDALGESREFLIDPVSGDLHRAYGLYPNMVYVIDPDGRVVYRLDWAHSKRVERVLERRELDSNDHRQIWSSPMRTFLPVTLRGGWNAVWDLAIVLPLFLYIHLKLDIAHFLKRRAEKRQTG